MATLLMRSGLRELHKDACGAHAGLLLQRGYPERDDSKPELKADHVKRICAVTADGFYCNAFSRWKKATSDHQRFRQVTLALESRLFIGLAGGGALETGCAISHSYGMPYIPGSSVKGVVSACARERLGEEGETACRELFGSEPNSQHPAGLAGLIGFHDAWWAPGSTEHPFVQEVVTSHHMDYYGSEGEKSATDFDSPVPNAQVAAQGAFLFVMEGPCAWLTLAKDILTDALSARGIGAKTRAGYGFFKREEVQEARPTCAWVDDKIASIAQAHKTDRESALRGRPLAEDWSRLDDSNLKREALQDIRARWQEREWWDKPQGKARKAAKKIYDSQP